MPRNRPAGHRLPDEWRPLGLTAMRAALVSVVLPVLLLTAVGPRVTTTTIAAALLDWPATCVAILMLCGVIGAFNPNPSV